MSFVRLLGSELERFLARRMARGLVLAVLGIGVLVGVLVFINSNPGPRESGFGATELLSSWGGDIVDWSEERPTRETWSRYGWSELYPGLDGIVGGIGMTVALLFGGIVGASFLGAEYRYGTIEQVLLWEPRRHRLMIAKYLVAFIGSALITMFAIACFAAALWPAAVWRGTTAGVDGRFWLDLLSVIGRTGIVAGLFGVIAATVALVTLPGHWSRCTPQRSPPSASWCSAAGTWRDPGPRRPLPVRAQRRPVPDGGGLDAPPRRRLGPGLLRRVGPG